MKAKIQQKLCELEQEYNIEILFASESGSRGWGFSSPDSDYDVRFVFLRSTNYYLSIQKKEDQLTFPVSNELDLSGWDLAKTLQLITKSNSSPMEWLQSPIIYRESNYFKQEMLNLCAYYFCARTCIHHYLGIAKSAMGSINGESIKIKKLFYILRPLLSALWCVEKNTIPPMNIQPLSELFPEELKQQVGGLIESKTVSEKGLQIEISLELRTWIDETYSKCVHQSALIEKARPDISKANNYFRETLNNDYTGNKR